MTAVYEQRLIGNVWYDVVDPWDKRHIVEASTIERAQEYCDEQLEDQAAAEGWADGYHDQDGWQIIRVFEDAQTDKKTETVIDNNYTATCCHTTESVMEQRGMWQSDFI
jgi:hypothetical protein